MAWPERHLDPERYCNGLEAYSLDEVGVGEMSSFGIETDPCTRVPYPNVVRPSRYNVQHIHHTSCVELELYSRVH